MKIRSIILTLVGIVVLAASPAGALAVNSNASDRAATKATRVSTAEQNKIENWKNRGSQEIDRRITHLNKLVVRITEGKRITAEQKTTLTSGIQKEIAALEALKTKIAASTDLTTLRADIKSITDSYKVYLLYMPMANILRASDDIQTVAADLEALVPKLEILIAEMKTTSNANVNANANANSNENLNVKTNGTAVSNANTNTVTTKDITALEAKLVEMKAKIVSAKSQASQAKAAVESLTPEGYPGNKATLQGAHAMIVQGRQDLRTVIADGKAITNAAE